MQVAARAGTTEPRGNDGLPREARRTHHFRLSLPADPKGLADHHGDGIVACIGQLRCSRIEESPG